MNFGAKRCGAWAVFLLLTLGLAASPAFAALQVAFTQQSPSLSIGESGTWRVTVTNPDPTPVNNPTLVVTLPLDFTVISAGGGIESIGPPHTLTWTLPAVAANGGTQTVIFQARPNCNAETGQDITAQVNPPGGASALSAPITVKPPLVTVTLVDTLGSTVTNGSVGDTVTWVLSVENTGTGDLVQGANISFTLGSAFTFLSIGSTTGNNTPGSLTPGAPVLWNTGLIAAGAQALYQIQAVISGCNPVELINEVAMNWTDGSTPCLSQPKTTSNSVALIIREPQVDIIPNNPSPIDYCDGSDAIITITNLNADGPANLFELEVEGWPDSWVVTPTTSGVTFNDATNTFKDLPNIAPGGSLELTFHIEARDGVCAPTPSANLVFKPKYVNECGAEFGTVYFPPLVPAVWNMQPPVAPTIRVEKTGPTSAEVGDTGLTYSITVTYDGPASALPTIVTITDDYPDLSDHSYAFTVTDDDDGVDNGDKITWSKTFTSPGESVTHTVVMDAPTAADPCAAFGPYTNNVTVDSVPNDCRDCPGTIQNDSLTTFLTDTAGDALQSSSISRVSDNNVCSDLTLMTCYTFGTGAPGSWSGVLLNSEITPTPAGLTFVAIDKIEVNGTDYRASCGGAFPLDLSCLNGAGALPPNAGGGVELCVTYSYSVQNADGNYTVHSWLELPAGYGSGCSSSPEYDAQAELTIAGARMTVDAYGSPPILNQCQINTYSIDIGGTRTLYDAQVTLNTMGNYRYIDTVSFTNIEEDPSGTGIIVFEPTPSSPGIYTWDFGTDIKPQGTIAFRMQQICGKGKDWSASGKYHNKCENNTFLPLRNATPNPDTDTPILLRSGIPTLHLVPAQIFANNRFPEEQLFIVNGGSGPMYNATLTLQLDTDLEYYAHAVSIGPGPDAVTVSLNKRTVTFVYNEIPAGAQRALIVTDQLLGCENLDITATVVWGCDRDGNGSIDPCATVSKTTTVLLPTAELLVVDHQGTKLDYCDDQDGTILIGVNNLGKADVYHVKIEELLPPGVTYVATSSATHTGGYGGLTGAPGVTVVNDFNGTGRQLITWDFSGVLPLDTEIVPVAAMKPGSRLEVQFTVQFVDCAAALAYAASNRKAEAAASFDPPCNFDAGTSNLKSPARIFTTTLDNPNVTVAKRARNVTKGTAFNGTEVDADPGDTLEWEITVSSVGDYPAKDVTVSDALPANVTYVAGTGILDAVTPLADTWYAGTNLGVMDPGGVSAVHVITFRTTVNSGGCTAEPTANSATVSYGCCSDPAKETAEDSMVLRTRPDFATAGGALSASDSNWTTCGGEVTLILTNTGSTAINQSVVDTLPGGYVFDSTGACTVTAANTPSGVVHDTDPGNAGNQPLNCNGVSGATPTWGPSNLDAVFPGETITIRYYVKTDGSTYCDTTKANDAVDPADVPIPNLTNRVTFNHQDSCAATYNPTNTDGIDPRQPDIDIVKSPEKQIVAEGGAATWTITLTNKGDTAARNITLTDELGNGFTSPADNRSGSWSGNTYTLNILGPINSGATYQVIITATVGAGSLLDHATVEGGCKDQGETATCTYTHDEDNAYTAGFALAKSVDKATANIGEELTYAVAAKFTNTDPFQNVVITDTLPPNTTYVSAIQNGGDFNIVPTPSGQTLTWNLPNFNGPKLFSYLVKVRVNNVLPANQSGTVLTNRVQADFGIVFGDGSTAIFTDSKSAQTTLTEPKLVIDKTIAPDAGIQAGSPVTVTLQVSNSGTGLAYDVNVSDLLNDTNNDGVVDGGDITVYDCSSINLGASGVNYPADFTAAVTGAAPACRVSYTRNGDVSIAAGGSRTFNFTVNIAAGVPTGSVYTDKATTEGKSLPPSDPQSGNTNYNRSTADDDTHNVSLESTSLQNKVIVASSESSTLLNNVAIGEVVTYRLPFVFPAGITRAVTIADELPDGLEYLAETAQLDRDTTDITTQANPGGINGNTPLSPVAVTLVPATGAVTLYLGNVTSQNGAHQLILTLKCLVKNITTNNSGTPLNDRSRIQWQDDDGTPYTTPGNPLTVTVVEPIPAIDKTADPLSGEAGDLITFTLKLSNTGNATAFDWEFKDPLPVVNYADPQFVSADISNAPGAVVSFCAAETSYFNGNNLCGRISSVDPGEWVLITYTAKLAQTVVFGQTVNNTATFTTTSLPGDKGTGDATPGDPGTTTGERTGGGTGPNDLRGQDSTSQTILVPTMSKIILSPQSWYSIGAEVTYQITVGVPSGTTSNFLVKDELPAGLTYVDGSASVAPPAGFSPATPVFTWDSGTRIITWNFGTVVQQPPAGNLVITYQARVENILTNQDGVPLPNKATFTYGSPATSITSSKTITVGEPNLYLEKSPQTTPVALVAGAKIRYRVEFRNDGHTTAYQANWEDVLPFVSAGPPVNGLGNISNPGLVIVTGGVTANNSSTALTTGDLTITTANSSNDKISLPAFQMSPGSRFYVEFDCQLLDGVVAGTNYSNATAVDYASRAEAGPDVRDAGSDMVDDDNNNDLDNYRESAAHTLKADATIAIEKSLPGGINRLTIGEAFVYRLRVWVIQGVSPSVVVTDTLADGLSYVSHVVLVPLGGIQFQQQLFAASGQDLSFDFGNATNAPTGGNGPKDYFDIEITVRVANVIGNQNGITHDNQGTVSFVPVGGQVSEDSNIVTTTVTEPALTVQKTPTPVVQSRGNEVTYQISVSHALVSTAPAHDVLMTDTLPAGLTFVSTTAVDYTQVGQNLTFRKSVINLGETWSFTYIVRVDDDAQLAPPMLNGVELTWAGTPGGNGDPDSGRNGEDGPGGLNDYSGETIAPVTGAAPDLSLLKSDGGVSVQPGGTIPYTLTYQNKGTWPASGVVITEKVPLWTVFNSAASTPGWTCLPDANAGSTCTYPVPGGVVNPGPAASVIFALTVANPFPAGIVQVSNQASIADDGKNGPDGNPGDETAQDETPVDAAPDLAIGKTDGVTTVVPGQSLTYTLSVTNSGNQDAAGVLVTDVIPDHTTFIGADPPATETSPGSGVITWTTIIPGGGTTATFQVTVMVDNPIAVGVTTLTNSATVSHPRDASPNNNSAEDIDDVNAAPDLAIAKSDGVVAAAPGDLLQYTLIITNIGNRDAVGVQVTDVLPPFTSFVSASDSYNLAGNLVTWVVDLPGGGAFTTRTVTVIVNNPFAAGVEAITNQAAVSHPEDRNPDNNGAADTDAVGAAPDLAITKTDNRDTVQPGDTLTYTLTITNIGNQNAANAIVTDTVPPNTTFVGASDGGAETAPGSGVVTWTLPLVSGGGASVTRTVTVIVDNPIVAGLSALTNRAAVSHPEDLNSANNNAADIDTVDATPDLALTKSDGVDTVQPGQTLTYMLTITNRGKQDAADVALTDTLPHHTRFVAASDGGAETVPGSGVVIWPPFSVPGGGAAVTRTVMVTVNNPMTAGVESITNHAVIIAPEDKSPEDNTAADTDGVTAVPDLALAKSDGVDTVQPGQTLTYTLTITNTGNQDAAGVNLTDTLPPYTSFVRASDGGVLSGSVVTWPPFLVPGGGASVVRTVTVKVSSALPSGITEIKNSAVMKHPEDASPDNNTAVDTDTVNAAPDLSLTKQGPASIMAGTPIVYTLLYANKGNQDATGVAIVETVPKNASFVASASSPGWSCADGAPAGSKCTYSIGPLAANTSGKVLFAVITDKKYKGDPLTNTASIHDDGNNGVDPIAGNNTGSTATVIEPFPIPALNPWGMLFSVLFAVFGAVLCMRRWKVIR